MFFGLHKMKIIHYLFSLWSPLELGTFLISEDPYPNFELFQTETWYFFDFLTPPPPLFGPFPKFPCFLLWKASLSFAYINQKHTARVILAQLYAK